MGILADGWRDAQNDTEALIAALKVVVKKFNEALHPRGADGRFISKGGWVKWRNSNDLWERGQVEQVNTHKQSGKDVAFLKIRKSSGNVITMSPSEVHCAKSPIAKISDSYHQSMKKVGPQKGSTPGALYEAADGNKIYVKTPKTEKHVVNELIAHKMYAAVGVATPDVGISEDKKSFFSKIEESVAWGQLDGPDKDKILDEIRRNFVVDAWLANWDAPVTDNIRVTKDGTPLRVDTGGALDYRAQGASKVKALTPEVKELQTLRDPHVNSAGAQLYGPTTKLQEEDGVKRILALTPDAIEELVVSEGGPKRLAKDLIARRAWLATHYGYQLPEATSSGKSMLDKHVDANAAAGGDLEDPSLASAVKKLTPGEAPALTPGSPVWLKDKKKYGNGLKDVWVISDKPSADPDKIEITALKDSDSYLVEAKDLEPLQSNHTAFGVHYSDGETFANIDDHVTLPTGESGKVTELFPKYAKVEIENPGGKPVKKTLLISKLTHKTQELDATDSKSDEKKSGLYATPYKPEYAEYQKKYRAIAVAEITHGNMGGASAYVDDREFETSKLHPTQPIDMTKTGGSGQGPKDFLPIVAKINDDLYLLDGHHRASKTDKIQAHYVNLDLIGNIESKHESQSVESPWLYHDWELNPNPKVRLASNKDSVGTVNFYDPQLPFVAVQVVEDMPDMVTFFELEDLLPDGQ